MKKLMIALLAFTLIAAAAVPVYAAAPKAGTWQVDGSLSWATGPDPFDDDFGITFGGGYMLNQIDNMMVRADLSYFSFDRNVALTNVDYTRIPILFSGRYYFPMMQNLNLFAEAGLEVSFDEAEFVNLAGVKFTEDEVNVGFTPGGGAQFYLNDSVSLFALARFHVITDDYFSLHFGGAFHF